MVVEKKRTVALDECRPPHLTAFVFGSHKENSASCGHSFSLRQLVSRLQVTTSCPVCGDQFGYVHDGEIEDEGSRDEGSRDEDQVGGHTQFVYFKYNKIAFRLSVASKESIRSSARPSWIWRSLFGSSISQNRYLETTAQGRIRSALCLSSEMKVLCKGKVLYSASSTLSNDEVSRELLQHSVSSWNNRAPPSLMVVGTPASLQSQWLQNEQRQLEKGKHPWLIRIGLSVVYCSVRTTADLLVSALSWLQRAVFGEQQQHIRQD